MMTLDIKKPMIIGIGGPSCAGKSTVAKRLEETLELETTLIGIDSYYRDLPVILMDDLEEWNFDRPEAFDKKLLTKHMKVLAEGESIERPIYSYSRHAREPYGVRIEPTDIIILEGHYALYWAELRGLYLTSIFIAASEDICFNRKIRRDKEERNLTLKYSLEQWEKYVQPMYWKFIHPTRYFAHYMASGLDPVDKTVEGIIKHLSLIFER